MTNDVAKLEALANELAAVPDGIETKTAAEHPEVKTLELLRATTIDRLNEIDALVSERDNYKRGLEVSEAGRAADGERYENEIAALRRRVAKLSSDLAFFQATDQRKGDTLVALSRQIERGLADARNDAARRPKETDMPTTFPEDGEPLPQAGKPWRNVLPLPKAQDITHFAPKEMRR